MKNQAAVAHLDKSVRLPKIRVKNPFTWESALHLYNRYTRLFPKFYADAIRITSVKDLKSMVFYFILFFTLFSIVGYMDITYGI